MRISVTAECRQDMARVLFLAWIVCLHVLPLLHNLDHRADHSHGALQSVDGPAEAPEHVHPPGVYPNHRHPVPDASSHDPEPLSEDHGSGSTLHFALALVETSPTLDVVPPTKTVAVFEPALPRATSQATFATVARGPPEASLT